MSYSPKQQEIPAGAALERLVNCRLQGGRDVVTSLQVCQHLGGAVLPTEIDPATASTDTGLVLCRLPGEGDVVMTRDSCIANGGTIIVKGGTPAGPTT